MSLTCDQAPSLYFFGVPEDTVKLPATMRPPPRSSSSPDPDHGRFVDDVQEFMCLTCAQALSFYFVANLRRHQHRAHGRSDVVLTRTQDAQSPQPPPKAEPIKFHI